MALIFLLKTPAERTVMILYSRNQQPAEIDQEKNTDRLKTLIWHAEKVRYVLLANKIRNS